MAKHVAAWQVELTAQNGTVLYTGALTHIMPREDLILKKSEEFFSDPAPCFIHRSAVMKRLFMEFEEYLNERGQQAQTVKIEELPEGIADLVRIDPNVYQIRCWIQ